ncbi:MAG: DUF3343 domain-containing protein [Ruminococcaceae bacterium]|nr:DUF3343 domain-containing protein [Oscillospiraceae bacterium]
MKYYLATFSSITFANKIKKHLINTPGFITLMHTPSSLSEKGCSYALRFREDKLKEVLDTAEEMNIKILGLYTEENNLFKKLK